jgi:hypothetical protein
MASPSGEKYASSNTLMAYAEADVAGGIAMFFGEIVEKALSNVVEAAIGPSKL